jgi:hypothetical protein
VLLLTGQQQQQQSLGCMLSAHRMCGCDKQTGKLPCHIHAGRVQRHRPALKAANTSSMGAVAMLLALLPVKCVIDAPMTRNWRMSWVEKAWKRRTRTARSSRILNWVG